MKKRFYKFVCVGLVLLLLISLLGGCGESDQPENASMSDTFLVATMPEDYSRPEKKDLSDLDLSLVKPNMTEDEIDALLGLSSGDLNDYKGVNIYNSTSPFWELDEERTLYILLDNNGALSRSEFQELLSGLFGGTYTYEEYREILNRRTQYAYIEYTTEDENGKLQKETEILFDVRETKNG